MKRRVLIGLLLLVLAGVGLFGWLVSSESGLQWVFRQATPMLPGELRVQRLTGSMNDRILLHGVEFTQGSTRVRIDRVELRWNPWALWTGDIDIASLVVQQLEIDQSAPDAVAAESGPLQLPTIALPLDIALQSMLVEQARYTRGEQSFALDRATLAATLQDSQLRIGQLRLEAAQPVGQAAAVQAFELQLDGAVRLAGNYAHDLTTAWQMRLAGDELWQNDTRVAGDLDATKLTYRARGPLQGQLSLQLQTPFERLRWQVEADIESFDTRRLDPGLPVVSGRLELSAAGDAEKAQARGRLDADAADVGQFDARFELSSLDPVRIADGVQIDALEVAIYDGQLAAQGQVYWSPVLAWTLQLEASDIDPVTRFAEWPGRITARLDSSGQLGEAGLDARAEISDASGRLRDYPFTLQGRLHWFDDSLQIDAARLTSGSTRVEASGRVGEAFDLDWSLQSDQLAELYPAAAGQLSASGRLAGERSAPIVEAQFTGRGLAVEAFRAASVDGEITLDLLNWQQLDIQLDARELDLRGQPLQTLTVAGTQRRIDASLTAPEFTATLALQGALVENGWQGRLASASIDSAEFDDWRLQAPAELGYVDKTFTLAPACLQSNRQSRICAQLRDAGGETRVGLDLARVPLGLLRLWMPPDLVVEGAIDAAAEFTLRAGERPLGKLDANLTSARASYRLDDRVERFNFDAIEFSLALDADQASAAASARRDNGDRVQASISLPGANILELDQQQQPLQATLRVDARDLGILDRLLVQVENLGGHLRADLDIDGTLANPRLYVNATLDDGSIDIPEQALGLERINASLRSERAQPARIELDAAAAGGDIGLRARSSQPLAIDPLCLATSQAPQSCSNLMQADASWNIELALKRIPLRLLERWTAAGLEFDGVFDADADLQYQNQGRLLGTIDASLPAASASFAYEVDAEQKSERLQYRSGRLQLALGAQQASVDGDLTLQNGDRLDTRIVLPGADLLDLDLQRQPLRGQIRVDARDWTLLDAMLPQVANLQGILRADLELDGNLGAPRVQGQATIEQGSIDLLQSRMRLERINLRARSDGPERVRFDAEAATAGGTIALSGITLLERDAGWETSLDLSGDGLDIATLIAQWVEQPLKIDGRMQAQASLRYRAPDRLLGDVRLSSAQGELAYPLLEREAESWRYHDASLHFELGEQGISARSALRIGSDNTLEAALDLPGAKLLALDAEQQDLGGRASLYFTELGLVQHLLPEVDRMQGELTLGLEFAGKLASPLLLADARMQDASFNVPRLGLQIEAIDLRGQSDAQDRFNFELTARSGEGSLLVNGSSLLDAARGWPTSIQVRGENFEVSKIPEAHVKVSPDLAISVEGREILIEGDVLLPYAKLQPRDISTAARVSNDTVIIGMEKPAEERWLVTTRVNVILGDRVTFFGFGFEGKLGGRLRIDDAPGQLSVGTGEITIPEGRYRAYGQRLDIENGRLLFTGSALDNPGLDVRAIRRVNDIVVGLQLRGRVKQPELELFSIPPMGQTDTLSYLILGRPMEGASESEGEMVAKAALALGLAGGDTLARRLGDQFGLDEVRVESSDDGDQASLVVGRYLSPRLYVSYGVGLIESINSLRLRYELTERWEVQAESGEEHGADLLFSIER